MLFQAMAAARGLLGMTAPTSAMGPTAAASAMAARRHLSWNVLKDAEEERQEARAHQDGTPTAAGAQAAEEIRHPGSGLPVERMGQAGPGPASMGEFGEGGSNYVMPEGATNKPHGRVVAEAWDDPEAKRAERELPGAMRTSVPNTDEIPTRGQPNQDLGEKVSSAIKSAVKGTVETLKHGVNNAGQPQIMEEAERLRKN